MSKWDAVWSHLIENKSCTEVSAFRGCTSEKVGAIQYFWWVIFIFLPWCHFSILMMKSFTLFFPKFILLLFACESDCLACRISLPSCCAILPFSLLFFILKCHAKVFHWQHKKCAIRDTLSAYVELFNLHFPTPDLYFNVLLTSSFRSLWREIGNIVYL